MNSVSEHFYQIINHGDVSQSLELISNSLKANKYLEALKICELSLKKFGNIPELIVSKCSIYRSQLMTERNIKTLKSELLKDQHFLLYLELSKNYIYSPRPNVPSAKKAAQNSIDFSQMADNLEASDIVNNCDEIIKIDSQLEFLVNHANTYRDCDKLLELASKCRKIRSSQNNLFQFVVDFYLNKMATLSYILIKDFNINDIEPHPSVEGLMKLNETGFDHILVNQRGL